MAKKKTATYTVRKVEDETFNPYDFVEKALDENKEPILDDNGDPLQYISTRVKEAWFRRVFPDGKIATKRIMTENPRCLRYKAYVYKSTEDTDNQFLACREKQKTYSSKASDAEADRMSAATETIALGRALSSAGFGCEIEAFLGLRIEGEFETTPKNLDSSEVEIAVPVKEVAEKKTSAKTKTVKDKEETPVAENETSDILSLLQEVEEEVKAEIKPKKAKKPANKKASKTKEVVEEEEKEVEADVLESETEESKEVELDAEIEPEVETKTIDENPEVEVEVEEVEETNKVETTNSPELDVARNVTFEALDTASLTLIQHNGKTLGELTDNFPNFEATLLRKNIATQITEEVLNAAKVIHKAKKTTK